MECCKSARRPLHDSQKPRSENSIPGTQTAYCTWAKRLKVYMRQRHIGGEKLFVDYSGTKPQIRDVLTGLDREVELLVMAWGLSQCIYAEGQESQRLPDWINGHRRGYELHKIIYKEKK